MMRYKKICPAIILSDSELNEILDLVTVVAMPLRIRISKRETLKEDSDVMIEQLRSVAKSRIDEKIASINDE